MSEPTNAAPAQIDNEAAKTRTRVRKPKAGKQEIVSLIDQAVKFRTSLHDLLHESSQLVKALKQQRRQSKVVQQTIDQIRSLKTLV